MGAKPQQSTCYNRPWYNEVALQQVVVFHQHCNLDEQMVSSGNHFHSLILPIVYILIFEGKFKFIFIFFYIWKKNLDRLWKSFHSNVYFINCITYPSVICIQLYLYPIHLFIRNLYPIVSVSNPLIHP